MSNPTETLNGAHGAAEDHDAAPSGVWRAVRESLRGSRQDYTRGPLGRAILLLAVPMVLEMVMESVFAVVDIFFVSRLGSDEVATVGLTESLLTLLYALAMGLGIGASAMVARRTGERDAEGASTTAVQALALGVVISIVLGALGVVFAPQLLRLMGASPGVLAHVAFTRVMLGGNITILMLFLINAVFRGAGDAAIAMRVLWLANIINILLGPCLIFGLGPFPELGVVGAAVATNIGRGTGALYALSRLLRPGSRISLSARHLRVLPSLMLRVLRLSASGTIQVFIGMASWIGLIRIISSFGSEALAGYTIGIRVIIFALLPSFGMANAAATLVGQSLGAGKPERAEQAVWRAGFYNVCFLGTIGLVFIIFAHPIISLFAPTPEAHEYGTACLRTVAYGFLFYAYGMVITQSFNGAGDTLTPTILNLFVFWLWEIPLAYVLAVTFGFGPRGVFYAITIAFSTLALASALIFRRGRWKTRMV